MSPMVPGEGGSQRPEEGIDASGRRPGPKAASTVAMDSEIRDFFDREYSPVVLFTMHCGASLASAEAATHAAFGEAVRAVRHGTWADIPNQRAWVRTVAYQNYRLLPSLLSAPVAPAVDLPEGTWPRDSRRVLTRRTLRVLKAIHALPGEQRVVVAFSRDEFPVPVIAAHLNLTEKKVENLLKDARKALSKQLAGMTTPEEANP
jgi:DNA-directed RNA polymerase specialized sigma24 family protein